VHTASETADVVRLQKTASATSSGLPRGRVTAREVRSWRSGDRLPGEEVHPSTGRAVDSGESLQPTESARQEATAAVRNQRIERVYRGEIISLIGESASFEARLRGVGRNRGEELLASFPMYLVADDELDLVEPGAEFYWTTVCSAPAGRPRLESMVELIRRPYWRQSELDSAREEAAAMMAWIQTNRSSV
jgi:hypothetical protein